MMIHAVVDAQGNFISLILDPVNLSRVAASSQVVEVDSALGFTFVTGRTTYDGQWHTLVPPSPGGTSVTISLPMPEEPFFSPLIPVEQGEPE